MRAVVLVFACLAAALAAAAEPVRLYVSASGSDASASCSQSAPCATLGGAADAVAASGLPSVVISVGAGVYASGLGRANVTFACDVEIAGAAGAATPPVVDCGRAQTLTLGPATAARISGVNFHSCSVRFATCVNVAVEGCSFANTSALAIGADAGASLNASIAATEFANSTLHVTAVAAVVANVTLAYVSSRDYAATGDALAAVSVELAHRQSAVAIANSSFSGASIANSTRCQGAALMASAPSVTLRGVLLTQNSLECTAAGSGSVPLDATRGGGAAFVCAGSALLADVLAHNNTLTLAGIPAWDDGAAVASAGGGAVVVCANDSLEVVADRLSCSANAVRAAGLVVAAPQATIGGGSVLVAGQGFVSMLVTRSLFAAELVNAAGIVALRSVAFSNNGGGAILLAAGGAANITVLESVMVGQRVSAFGARTPGGSNVNGGGALYVYSNDAAVMTIGAQTYVGSQLVNASSAFAAQDNYNGGGAVLVNSFASCSVTVAHGVVFSAQRVLAVDCEAAQGSNYNGGGALNLSPSTWARLRVTNGTIFAGQLVAADRNVANGSNCNGGAAIYVNALAPASAIVSRNVSFVDQLVSVADNCALGVASSGNSGGSLTPGNENGGAGLYVFATGFVDVEVSGSVMLRNQSVAARNATTAEANSSGGAGIYVNSATDGASIRVCDAVSLELQEVDAENSVAQFNFNGGAAIYTLTQLDTVLLVSNSSFSQQIVRAANSTCTNGNYAGGAALYVNPTGGATVTIADSVAFSAQLVNATDNVARSSGASNYNGGAAVFVNPTNDAVVTLRNVSFAQQTVLARGNLANAGNFNGGGALYANSYASVVLQVDDSRLLQQVVDVPASNCSAGSNNNGGAALYVYASMRAFVSVSTTEFAEQAVSADNSVARESNYNGGGGLYVFGLEDAQVSIAESAFRTQSVTCMASEATLGSNLNGGAGVYINADNRDAQLSVQNGTFEQQSVVAVRNSANDTNYNGGAALYANSDLGNVVVSVLGATFAQQFVDTSFSQSAYGDNGGASVYAHADVSISMFVDLSLFTQQVAVLSQANSTWANYNGGGGVYAVSDIGVTNVTLSRCFFSDASVRADASVALVSNSNGGGAAYVNAGTDANVTLIDVALASTSVSVNDNAASLGNVYNGGGAVYVYASGRTWLAARNASLSRASLSMDNNSAVQGDVYNGGSALLVNSERDAVIVLVGVAVTSSRLASAVTSASRGRVYLGGAMFVLSSGGSVCIDAQGITITDSLFVALSLLSGDATVSGVCGGGDLFVVAQLDVQAAMRASTFSNSSLSIAQATPSSALAAAQAGDWYLGGSVMLAVSLASSTSVNWTDVNVLGCAASVAGVRTSARIVAGGGALLAVGQLAANTLLLRSVVHSAYLSVADLQSQDNQVVAGGAGVALAAVNRCQNARMVLSVLDSAISACRLSVGAIDGQKSVAGGGAVNAVTANAQLAVVLSNSTFADNTLVLQHELTAAAGSLTQRVLGGGALLVSNDVAVRSTGNKIVLLDVSFLRNAMIVDAIDEQAIVTLQFAVLGGGGALLDAQVLVSIDNGLFEGNSVSAACGECVGGGLVTAGLSNVVQSRFAGNNAARGGGLALAAGSLLNTTEVVANAASTEGGGVLITQGSVVLDSCWVSNNTAGAFGGGISVSLSVTLVLVGTTVAANSAPAGGGLSASDSASVSLVNGTLLHGNVATVASGGGVQLELVAQLTVSRAVLVSCMAAETGGAVALFDAATAELEHASIVNCTSGMDGGGVYVDTDAQATLTATSIAGCASLGASGGGLLVFGQTTVANSVLRGSSAMRGGGGGVRVGGAGRVTARDLLVVECFAASTGGGILLTEQALLNCTPCTIESNAAAADGGGAYVNTVDAPWATGSTLYVAGNVARRGGGVALAALSSQGLIAYLSALHAIVAENNTALVSAPLSRVGPAVAAGGAGGAGAGGAWFFDLSWSAPDPGAAGTTQALLAQLAAAVADARARQPSTWRSNSAAGYGPWASSTWVSVHVVPFFTQAWRGGLLQASLDPRDAFNQSMVTLGASLVEYACAACASTSGLSVLEQNGTSVSAMGVTLAGVSGENVSLVLRPQSAASSAATAAAASSPTAAVFGSTVIVPTVVSVLLHACPLGSGPAGVHALCQNCSQGQYAVNTSAPCVSCPDNVVCLGGAEVYVANNYWPHVSAAPARLTAVRCPYDYCERGEVTVPVAGGALVDLGGVGLGNGSSGCCAGRDGGSGNGTSGDVGGICGEGLHRVSSSALCGECVPGYSEWNHVCLECQHGYNSGAIMLQLAEIFAYVLIQRILAQQLPKQGGGGGGAGFMLAVFFCQFAELAVYPNEVLSVLVNALSLRLPSSASLGCPFATGGGYGELVVRLMMPVAYMAAIAVIFACHRLALRLAERVCTRQAGCCARLRGIIAVTAVPDVYARTVVVLLLNLYETIVEAAFQFLVCAPGVEVLFLYPSVSCATEQYAGVRSALLVLLALLCVGVPLAIALALLRFKRKHGGSLHHAARYFGALFHHYTDALFWWESMLLARRASLLVVFVPLAGAEPVLAKAALAITVLVWALVQLFVRPYKHNLDNYLEIACLGGMTALIGAGLAMDLESGSGGPAYYIAAVIVVAEVLLLLAPSVIGLGRLLRELATGAIQRLRNRARLGSSSDSLASSAGAASADDDAAATVHGVSAPAPADSRAVELKASLLEHE